MHRVLRFVCILAAATIIAVGIGGCSCTPGGSGSPTAIAPSGTTPDAVTRTFLDASRKHGTLTFVSGKEQKEDKVEYWFDGNRYRLTWYNPDGTERLHMISPDGEKLYYCYVAEKVCAISYTLPEMHQWVFNGPEGWELGAGVPDGDLTAYTYDAKKLWDIEGASQQFYVEDLVVYANTTRIAKTVTRTNSHKPESPDDLVTSEYRFDEPEIGGDIPAKVFDLPYEIGDKP
ncbi:MAG: hypothetical protein Q8S43_04100 [Actinomycetota bacterium]|nr:MAG: hypothetical protein FD171_292 [Actinomycetota bacterium]MDO8950333.1 hypothetical protein [Actinomycetota bacterium]MDP3630118.1 hypothetical protein [Actinomycetota bacterium]